MTRDQLISFLEGRGYKSYPIPRIESDGVVWTGSKRLPEGSTECDTNGKKVSYHAKIWRWEIDRSYVENRLWVKKIDEHTGIDIEIVAEKHGQWVNLKSCGIPWNEVEKQLSVAETCLSNAWEAVARQKFEEDDNEEI